MLTIDLASIIFQILAAHFHPASRKNIFWLFGQITKKPTRNSYKKSKAGNLILTSLFFIVDNHDLWAS